MTEPADEQWTFVFQALPSDVPAAIRYRKMLKYSGRYLRLECRRVLGEADTARLLARDEMSQPEKSQSGF
jgi:hypothetical protein